MRVPLAKCLNVVFVSVILLYLIEPNPTLNDFLFMLVSSLMGATLVWLMWMENNEGRG